MIDTVRIHCLNTGEYKDVPVGSSLEELIDIFGVKKPYLIANARVNNKTEALTYKVYHPRRVEFNDLSDSSAMRTYVRSLCFVLSKAVDDTLHNAKVFIEHAVSRGYYFYIESEEAVGEKELMAIKKRMQEIIDANIPFVQVEEEIDQVVKLFRENGMDDKALLLETSDELLYARYSKLDNYIDYYYGCLLPSTGYLNLFDVVPYNGGYLLVIPNRQNPVELEPVIPQQKLLKVYREHIEFLKISKLDNVGDLNKAIRSNKISEIIQISEAYQANEIADIAKEITDRYNDGLRVVLISGPSSSGKTTFRKRLEVQLYVNRLKPVGISLDDYFIDREHTPLDEFGEKDYESLYAIDLDLFEKHVIALLNGEEIELPSYNFVTGQREFRNHRLVMDNKSVLIVEGIHALNPKLTEHISRNQKFMVYVSALTSISLDNHNWIPPADNRLLRRIVRDSRYRGYSAQETISRWDSVRRGEEKWIFPFQENADVMFNSAMIYELAAIRRHAEPVLQQVPRVAKEYSEAYRLLKFLRYFNYIGDKELPPTSLLREFLGGSSFRY
ncbi:MULTISPECIES: nucleoside kinase [Petrimonas]|jgi:uridine kinase|uniref:Threonine-tRNA ligase n=1 Tax=Petrimonas mucosa TaxID=1642646 RepID=A0A1G4G8L3_9BACT|nr:MULTISPECIES: nucleoside kinase [Petrimonas]MDD3560653.1 nucleoside kinase [Petrimonas mucosa]SCM58896.1 Threonine-tRNA ligase {ECO:0000255/HAMAP-Rule:MF_00184} [Petrimonas mucosa]SFU27239.1 uridine kinase [Porphyromonadaceae bacterium KHP3R9]HHT29404.1 nucleoside kinase [Petrimonas mucosa]